MRVFHLEFKCYSVNSYTFLQMLECYLWPLATAEPFIPACGTESQFCFLGVFHLFVCFNLPTLL